MADFVQTMKDWKRMCNAIGQEDEYTACDKCDLRLFGCPAIYEKECDSANWNHVERVVAKWAAEHPEPVYPSWYEWLSSISIVPNELPPEQAVMVTDIGLLKKIPAETAQRLGIEPLPKA